MRVQRSNTPILSPQTLAATEQMVERYRDIVPAAAGRRVAGAERLRVGSKSPAVTALRQRLIVSGDLDRPPAPRRSTILTSRPACAASRPATA